MKRLPRWQSSRVLPGVKPELMARRNFESLAGALLPYADAIEDTAYRLERAEKDISSLLPPAILGKGYVRDVREFGTIAKAITVLGSNTATLYITNAQTVSANLTIPSNISIVVVKGGSFAISSGVTLTINGAFDAPIGQVFSGSGTVVFGTGVLTYFYPEWWGAARNGSTNDYAAINAAMVCANASGGGVIRLSAGTYSMGTASTLSLLSNVDILGVSKHLSILSQASRTGTFTILSAGSTVTNVNLSRFRVTGQSDATNLATGLLSAGNNITVEDAEFLDCKYGITALSTAYENHFRRNRFNWSTSGDVGVWAILFNGSYDCSATDNMVIGTSLTMGANRGIAVKNGGRLYGAQNIVISGNRTKDLRNIGIGGYPDDGVEINGSTVNYRTLEFSKTASYTGAVAGDIGKAVHGSGATGRGVLVDYDNDARLWLISLTSGSFTAGDSITIPTGTGAGTQNADFAPYFGISGSYCTIFGNITSGGLDASIGTGIAVDDLWNSTVFGNSNHNHGSRGMFIGDGPNYGSVVALNSNPNNASSGIDCSRAKDTVIALNNNRRNQRSGIRQEAAVTGGNDNAVMVGNSNIENGLVGSGITGLDSGMAIDGNNGVHALNLNHRNNIHGMYIINAAGGVILGNSNVDNDFPDTAANYNGIHLDGTSTKNIILGNISRRYADTSLRQRNGLYITANGDDNLVGMNVLEPNSTSMTDGGLRNMSLYNFGDIVQSSSLAVSNTGTVNIPAISGVLIVWNVTSNCFGAFTLSGSAGLTVFEQEDTTDNFSAIKDTSSSTNVYYDSGASTYRLQNNTGGTRTYRLFFRGFRA